MRLVIAGWSVVVLVAILVVVVNGAREVGFSMVLTALAASMAAWAWRRASRPALVTSLVLGLLFVAMFGAYAIADAAAAAFDSQRFFTDLLGACGGAAIVAGAAWTLVERRRHRAATS